MYVRPLPSATLRMELPKEIAASTPALDWPVAGTAAVSAAGYDFLAVDGDANKLVSTASIAKVITALCVLEKKPLKIGEKGPVVAMTQADVDRFEIEASRDGTAFAVASGDALSEYDMLQTVLLPSANNTSDSLAIWAFGSLPAYRTYAADYLVRHNLMQTTIGADASGYDPATKSSLHDLVQLAKLALREPVIMEIVGQPRAIVNGTEVVNHNSLAGNGFITGLKTGRNNENSGSLLFSARKDQLTLVGVVADAGTLSDALSGASRLAESALDDFVTTHVVHAGQVVGMATTAWGSTVPVIAQSDIRLMHWRGEKIVRYELLQSVDGTRTGTIGTLYLRSDVKKASTPLVVTQPATGPSTLWRLTHLR